MGWQELISSAQSSWTSATGADSDVVISTRLRLARNLEGLPFPHIQTKAQAAEVMQAVAEGVRELNHVGLAPKTELYPLEQVTPLQRQVLVEKHLISPGLAASEGGAAVAISGDESISIMVNEEDHLRLQVLKSGLQLTEAWQLMSRVDDALEQKINYAFHETQGYLTACPTNLGTGMRASIMMHLPALVMTNQARGMFATMGQLGLVVRGLYGEGTEATGNIFQISNQVSLGHTEEEIIANLSDVAAKVLEHERRSRQVLLKDMKEQLEDQTGRALGLLQHARIMTSEEALKLLSHVRLGVDLGLLPPVSRSTFNELLVCTRPAFLQQSAGQPLSPFERDLRRADLIRERLAG